MRRVCILHMVAVLLVLIAESKHQVEDGILPSKAWREEEHTKTGWKRR